MTGSEGAGSATGLRDTVPLPVGWRPAAPGTVERRLRLRSPLNPELTCIVLVSHGPRAGAYSAKVLDLSTGGAKVMISCPASVFPPLGEAAVHLRMRSGTFLDRREARAIYANPTSDGYLIVGLAFIQPLDETEVRKLVNPESAEADT